MTRRLVDSLSQLCANFLLEVGHHLLHYGLNLLVLERLLVVLEEHGDSVTLLAGFEVLDFVHVEEGHLLEQLAFALLNPTLDLLVGHG